jgi:proline iminopeptidase
VKYPHRVSELIIRGVFLCRKKELDWLYEGHGANYLFPKEYERFQSLIPEEERRQSTMIEAYGRRIRGEIGSIEQERAIKEWITWESSICQFHPEPLEKIQTNFKLYPWESSKAFASIENHYFSSHCFLPGRDENHPYLVLDRYLRRLTGIPIVIIQGRYDTVCPPSTAFELIQALTRLNISESEGRQGAEDSPVKIVSVVGGHNGFEEEMIDAIVQATDSFRSPFTKRPRL